MSSIDARVRYTRKMIEDCFLQLLEKKPMNKITVTELCAMAQINRATFYKHYLDIPDLVEQMEAGLIADIRRLFRESDGLQQMFLTMVRSLKQDIRKYALLGSEHGDRELYSKIYAACFASSYPMTTSYLPELAPWQHELLHAYITYGIAGVLMSWIQSGAEREPEEVAAMIASLCMNTVASMKNGRDAL